MDTISFAAPPRVHCSHIIIMFSFTLLMPLTPRAANNREGAPLSELAYWMLLCNALWDYTCALCMHADTFLGWNSALADAHLDMWRLDADRENVSARLLFITLLIQWGVMRSIAAATDDPLIAVLSYGGEALLASYGALQGRMELRRASAVVFLSVLCAFVVVVQFKTDADKTPSV